MISAHSCDKINMQKMRCKRVCGLTHGINMVEVLINMKGKIVVLRYSVSLYLVNVVGLLSRCLNEM